MSNEGQPRGGFYADAESGVCYRDLGFIGLVGFRVSDDGTVWSCRRAIGLIGYRGAISSITNIWRKIKPGRNSKGYLAVGFYNSGVKKYIRVSRLVLMAFHGPCPVGMEACHFPDQTPSNNRLENLRWDTKSGNMKDKVDNGTSPAGVNNGRCKLTEQDVKGMRRDHAKGELSYAEAGRKYGLTKSAAKKVIDGVLWRHIK